MIMFNLQSKVKLEVKVISHYGPLSLYSPPVPSSATPHLSLLPSCIKTIHFLGWVLFVTAFLSGWISCSNLTFLCNVVPKRRSFRTTCKESNGLL